MGTEPDNPPTLLGIFPGFRRFPASSPLESPSRLCEICWCDHSLFPGSTTAPIIILDEAVYQALKQYGNREIPHGSLGEQFLVQRLQEASPQINSQISIGDAVLRVTGIVNFQAVKTGYQLPPDVYQQLFVIETSIIEEGLIEPGAPIRISNPQPDREK